MSTKSTLFPIRKQISFSLKHRHSSLYILRPLYKQAYAKHSTHSHTGAYEINYKLRLKLINRKAGHESAQQRIEDDAAHAVCTCVCGKHIIVGKWGAAEAIPSQLWLCAAQLERCLLYYLFFSRLSWSNKYFFSQKTIMEPLFHFISWFHLQMSRNLRDDLYCQVRSCVCVCVCFFFLMFPIFQ